ATSWSAPSTSSATRRRTGRTFHDRTHPVGGPGASGATGPPRVSGGQGRPDGHLPPARPEGGRGRPQRGVEGRRQAGDGERRPGRLERQRRPPRARPVRLDVLRL